MRYLLTKNILVRLKGLGIAQPNVILFINFKLISLRRSHGKHGKIILY